jgi:hypothetical protein
MVQMFFFTSNKPCLHDFDSPRSKHLIVPGVLQLTTMFWGPNHFACFSKHDFLFASTQIKPSWSRHVSPCAKTYTLKSFMCSLFGPTLDLQRQSDTHLDFRQTCPRLLSRPCTRCALHMTLSGLSWSLSPSLPLNHHHLTVVLGGYIS